MWESNELTSAQPWRLFIERREKRDTSLANFSSVVGILVHGPRDMIVSCPVLPITNTCQHPVMPLQSRRDAGEGGGGLVRAKSKQRRQLCSEEGHAASGARSWRLLQTNKLLRGLTEEGLGHGNRIKLCYKKGTIKLHSTAFPS